MSTQVEVSSADHPDFKSENIGERFDVTSALAGEGVSSILRIGGGKFGKGGRGDEEKKGIHCKQEILQNKFRAPALLFLYVQV